MDMNHLIGQRFILISKSDVRYIGTLHEINPEASTIALENVTSFGTEGRRGNPALEVPGSSSIYEYIVFRGSDVKDISVEGKKEPTQPEPHRIPDDPAIVGNVSRPGPGPDGAPPGLSQGPPPQQQGGPQNPQGYPPQPPPFQGGMYPGYGQRFGPPPPFPPGPGFPPYGAPNGAPPGWFPGQGYPQGPGFSHMPGYPAPPQHQRPGPPVVPNTTSELPGDKVAQSAPTPPVESKPSVAEALAPAAARGNVQPATPLVAPKPAVPTGPKAANQSFGDATSAATRAVAEAMAKLPPQRQNEASVDGITRKMNDMRPYNDNRAPRGAHQHPRGGRGGARPPPKSIEVPTSDYDFQTANAKFNKQDLVKEAIASGGPAAEAEAHTIHGAEDDEDDSSAALYNRSSSFFDNISSEARDREENRPGGREWRGVEEKRNIETFGQGSVDGYRGNYRGRGRGRGYSRGRGGFNRGGYGGRGRGNRATSQGTGVPSQV